MLWRCLAKDGVGLVGACLLGSLPLGVCQGLAPRRVDGGWGGGRRGGRASPFRLGASPLCASSKPDPITTCCLSCNQGVTNGEGARGICRRLSGPFSPLQAVVKSIHVKQCLTNHVEAGTAACFAIKKERRSDIRKGMVLVDAKNKPAVPPSRDCRPLVNP